MWITIVWTIISTLILLSSGHPQNLIRTSDEYTFYQYLLQAATAATRRPYFRYSTVSPARIGVSRAPNGSLVPFVNPNYTEAPTRAPIEISTSSSRDTDRIIFPSETEALKNPPQPYHQEITRDPPKMHRKKSTMTNRFGEHSVEERFLPKGCKDGSTICQNADDYPSEYVDQIVATNLGYQYADVFGDDIVPEVVQRVDYRDEEPLCQSKEIVIYPKVGQTKDNTWAYIINNANFSQGVRVEQCLQEHKPCAMTESFPYGYVTECKQKYIYRHLLALNEHGEQIKDLFRLPACCKCMVRSNFGSRIFSRNAAPAANASLETTTSGVTR